MDSLTFKLPLPQFSFHFHTHIKEDQLVSSSFKSSASAGVQVTFFLEDTTQAALDNALAWVLHYFEKKPYPIKLKFPSYSTPFSADILNTLLTIGFGSSISYGNLAHLASHTRAQRAVGSTCRKNPLPLWIPCHRVLGANQTLGGFAFGPSVKKQLLAHENLYSEPVSLDLFDTFSS